MLPSFPIEVRLALSNSMKSSKLGTEEARWECFIIWWRKIWALRSVFHTMTTQCSCWVVWQHKTTEAVWNRRELYFEVIDETHCFNCSNEKDSSEIVLVSHICSKSTSYYMVCFWGSFWAITQHVCTCQFRISLIVPMGCRIKGQNIKKLSKPVTVTPSFSFEWNSKWINILLLIDSPQHVALFEQHNMYY